MELGWATLVISFVTHVAGHGAMVYPLSRNAIDRNVGVKGWPSPCTCANVTDSHGKPQECRNAQSCYWFQQGCTIGCPTCTFGSPLTQNDTCGLGFKPTIMDNRLRTLNLKSEIGSEYDVYKHNPWRAPGTAPVADACGMAGGFPGPTMDKPNWADYVETKYAKKGDLGSKLPPVITDTTWRIGGLGKTAWQITGNHGGGYSYRLCPKTEPLTEECFQRHQLEFDTNSQWLQWNDGSSVKIQGIYTTNEGINGSTWAVNPIPVRCLDDKCHIGQVCRPLRPGEVGAPCDNTPWPSFPPHCDESKWPPSRVGLPTGNVSVSFHDHSHSAHLHGKVSVGWPANFTVGRCSGNQPYGNSSVSVVDLVKVPTNLAPGQYVLGFRYDSEATSQIWQSCADITLAAAETNILV